MCVLTYIPVHVFMEYVTNTNFDEFVIHSWRSDVLIRWLSFDALRLLVSQIFESLLNCVVKSRQECWPKLPDCFLPWGVTVWERD